MVKHVSQYCLLSLRNGLNLQVADVEMENPIDLKMFLIKSMFQSSKLYLTPSLFSRQATSQTGLGRMQLDSFQSE